jgi:hypothetical protein
MKHNITTISVLLAVIIMLVGSIGAGAGRAFAAPSNLICFDGDALQEWYYVGYVNAMNAFHHNNSTILLDKNMNATQIHDYKIGYRDGWIDASLKGWSLDPECVH